MGVTEGPPFGPWYMMPHAPMMRGFGAFAGRDLQVVIPLADGPWLAFATLV